jgi:hypothetical protein
MCADSNNGDRSIADSVKGSNKAKQKLSLNSNSTTATAIASSISTNTNSNTKAISTSNNNDLVVVAEQSNPTKEEKGKSLSASASGSHTVPSHVGQCQGQGLGLVDDKRLRIFYKLLAEFAKSTLSGIEQSIKQNAVKIKLNSV